MPGSKSSFLEKVLGRIGRLDAHGLQSVVRRLARERSFLETLFNTIEDGVLVVDADGRVLYLNQAGARMFGSPSISLEGQHISKCLPELNWADLTALDRAGGQQVVRHEFEVTYPRQRFLRLYAAPLDGEASGSSGLVLILHDATEARQKTFEAIESERVQALTLLAASVAHELGNPLNALYIHLQLIERELKKLRPSEPAASNSRPEPDTGKAAVLAPTPEEAQDLVRKIEKFVDVSKREITRLDYVITQFLQAIRPSPPQLRMASLNTVVEETLELLRPEFENRGQTIQEKLSPSLPNAPLDAAQLKQALVNLAKNSMQAMSKGGVLTARTGATTQEAWVSIADTGRGIPEDQLNRIFEPFFTTKRKGSGLGLMIVQRIIRAHGGRIEMDSKVGKGTRFRICLPLHEKQTRLLEDRQHA